jgi:glycosyltransferase involved in cell wall biosynthesis
MKLFSIFIPCYNEEKTLKRNIEKVVKFLDINKFNYELILVDDCSTDNTQIVMINLARRYPNVHYLSYKGRKPSRRENLLKSFKYAEGEYIIYMDEDLSTDLKCLFDLTNILLLEADSIVIGNRYHKDSKVKRSVKRYIISKGLNWFTRVLFFTGIKDHFIGFKGFPKKQLFKIIKKTGIGKKDRSMWWDAEALVEAQKLGYEIRTIPVKWKESKWTKLNFKREIGIIKYMLKKRWHDWIN